MSNFPKGLLCILILAILNFSANSQDTTTLDLQFQELKNSSETFEVYKVIRSTRLDNFWAVVMDSVSEANSEISSLDASISELQNELEQQQQDLASLQAQLEESETKNSTINFLGADIIKWVYHTIVWVIIAILSVVAVVVFTMYQRSHVVTAKAVDDLRKMTNEFENFKDKSREKQVKLKRELQTAVNNLDEFKRSKSARSVN